LVGLIITKARELFGFRLGEDKSDWIMGGGDDLDCEGLALLVCDGELVCLDLDADGVGERMIMALLRRV